MFSGDVKQFIWWKNKLYNFCITRDEDIWDFIEDGTTDVVNKDGKAINKKCLTTDEKKEYKKHHKARNIQVNVLEFKEFNKIVDKSTPKSTFDALYATYEGNQQIKEAMANLLVPRYETLKIKEDEDIENHVLQVSCFDIQNACT